MDNPLGTKGKLVKKYATLMKNLWYENKTCFTPYGIKSAVAEINPIVFLFINGIIYTNIFILYIKKVFRIQLIRFW